MPDTFLRVPDVCRIIGISRATLYEMMAKGEFPKPIKLSVGCTVWLEHEIDDLLNTKAAERGAT